MACSYKVYICAHWKYCSRCGCYHNVLIIAEKIICKRGGQKRSWSRSLKIRWPFHKKWYHQNIIVVLRRTTVLMFSPELCIYFTSKVWNRLTSRRLFGLSMQQQSIYLEMISLMTPAWSTHHSLRHIILLLLDWFGNFLVVSLKLCVRLMLKHCSIMFLDHYHSFQS